MENLNWNEAKPFDELDWSQAKPLDWSEAKPVDAHAARLAEIDSKIMDAKNRVGSGEWNMGWDYKTLYDTKTGKIVGDSSVFDRETHMTEGERSAYGTGMVRQFADGATFGLAGKGEAGIRALVGDGSYEGNLADIRQSQDEWAADNPAQATAMSAVGTAPTLLVGGGAATAARGLGGRMVAGAGVGGAYGAAEGYGHSRSEDALGTAEDTALGTAAGAVAGAVAPVATSAVAGVIKPVFRGIQRAFGVGTADAAQRTVETAIAADAKSLGRTFDEHVADLNQAASEGGFNSIVHVAGPEVKRAFIRAQKAGADVFQFFDEAGDHATRGRQALSPALGTRGYQAQEARLTAARKVEADTAYADVYAGAPQDMSALHPLQGRKAFREAIATANDALETSGAGVIPVAGKATAGHDFHKLSELTVEQADQLTRALQGQVDEAFANPKLKGTVAPALSKLRDQVAAELDVAFPELAAVRARYAEQSGPLHALEAGRSIPLKAGQAQDDAVKAAAKSATRNPRQFGVGTSQAALDTLANKGNAGVDALMSEAARPVREALPVSAQQALQHEQWLKRMNDLLGAKPGAETTPISPGTLASAVAQASMGHVHGAARTLAAGGLRGLVARGSMSRGEAEVLADMLMSRNIEAAAPRLGGGATNDAIMRALSAELMAGGSGAQQ